MFTSKKNVVVVLVTIVSLVAVVFGAQAVFAQSAMQTQALTRSQIVAAYQTVGLSSNACQTDPNGKACLDAWNKCTRDNHQTGCFYGWFWRSNGQPTQLLWGFNVQENASCTNIDVAAGTCAEYVQIP